MALTINQNRCKYCDELTVKIVDGVPLCGKHWLEYQQEKNIMDSIQNVGLRNREIE